MPLTPERVADARLCYVDGCWAYFTTQALDQQWGDDWNDAPYEHNAGRPYEWRADYDGKRGVPEWTITRLAFDGPLTTPDGGHRNSPYSVEQINAGAVAWLRRERWATDKPNATIPAGATIPEFIAAVESVGGHVYARHADLLAEVRRLEVENAALKEWEDRHFLAAKTWEKTADDLRALLGEARDELEWAKSYLPPEGQARVNATLAKQEG